MATAGKLREQLQFQRRQTASDGAGGQISDWVPMFDRMVELTPHKASGDTFEKVIANRLQGINLWDCWLRWDPEVAEIVPDHRAIDVNDPGRTFNIRAWNNIDERRRWVVLLLEQGVATG